MKSPLMQTLTACGLLSLTLLAGCVLNPDKPIPSAAAKLDAFDGNPIRGVVSFGEHQGMTRIFIDVTGLTGEHGFRIYDAPDCRTAMADLNKGRFNPEDKPAGERAGDLGNLRADVYGTMRGAVYNKTLVVTGKNSVIGRTLIITARPDDFRNPTDGRSNPANPAIACGQILPI